MTACSIDGCDKPAKAHGLCGTHYMRLRRTGDATTVRPPGVPGDARKHHLYSAWAGMVNRCSNPNNSSFQSYGARGIRVADRWRTGEDGRSGFECFLDDMGERPDGMTLDRYPNAHGNYEPGNCRWATASEQRRNITPEGDARMRAAMSAGVKKRWEAFRKVV